MTLPRLRALGELVEQVKTWAPSRSARSASFTYIDLSAVDQELKGIVGARELPCVEAPSRARQLVAEGDVLVSTVRPNLNAVARVGADQAGATASTGFCVLRPRSNELDRGYLFHWVRSSTFVNQMVRQATGASYPAVSDRIILDSLIPLPSLSEQRRIAEVLDRAEALRAKRRAAVAQLESLTQSIFLEMFGDPVANPKGWPSRKLGQCTSVIQIGPFGSLLHEEDYVSGGVPLVNPKHIRHGTIVPDPTESLTARKLASMSLYQMRQGDVVMGRRGEMGRCAIVTAAHDGLLCGTGSLFIRPDEAKATAMYLSGVLTSSSMRTRLERLSLGATLPNLNRGIVADLEIPLPPVDLQESFARRVSTVERLKSGMASSVVEFDSLFAALQQRAFQGAL